MTKSAAKKATAAMSAALTKIADSYQMDEIAVVIIKENSTNKNFMYKLPAKFLNTAVRVGAADTVMHILEMCPRVRVENELQTSFNTLKYIASKYNYDNIASMLDNAMYA